MFSSEFSQLTVKLNSPFTDQKPGTSGLRKSTLQFEEAHYLESFIESILCSLPGVQGGVLVVGGTVDMAIKERLILLFGWQLHMEFKKS